MVTRSARAFRNSKERGPYVSFPQGSFRRAIAYAAFLGLSAGSVAAQGSVSGDEWSGSVALYLHASDLLAEARYRGLSSDLSVGLPIIGTVGPLSGDRSWWDMLLGGRYLKALHLRRSVQVLADARAERPYMEMTIFPLWRASPNRFRALGTSANG